MRPFVDFDGAGDLKLLLPDDDAAMLRVARAFVATGWDRDPALQAGCHAGHRRGVDVDGRQVP
jgi:hypothetical protein